MSSQEKNRHDRTISILLADDHKIVRIGIRKLISRYNDLNVIGEANNGEETLQMVQELKPDVLLLDVEMPGMDGIEVARRLASAKSPVRILILSAYAEKEFILSALAQGVSGYLTKDEVPIKIIEAVRDAAGDKATKLGRKVVAHISA
ncbi:MAG: response regulator transcription factor [Chloroflexi bacterium]|nr:response regulator transcription factor [Chloroflexota bacterium]